jgi:hypothetical protein
MTEHKAPRNGWEVRANLVCTLCSRTIGRGSGPDSRSVTIASVSAVNASHASAVRRLRCPYCAGRLWFQDYEEIRVIQCSLTAEDLHPKRGRPRKIAQAS